jgi:Arc/MetJ-type ribon-helix-helix transcriptional regulator
MTEMMEIMEPINIVLPENLKTYSEERVRTGGYGNFGEYVCDLIRQEQERLRQERTEKMLLEGLRSGAGRTMSKSYWNGIRSEVGKQFISNRVK